MALGQLTLHNEKGIFYTELLSDFADRFVPLSKILSVNPVIYDGSEPPQQYQITPVTENNSGAYITGVFKSQSAPFDSYEITVWILVEEHPELTIINKQLTTKN